jgi:hypothetical protein
MSMYSAGDSFRHLGNSTAKVFAALLCAALVSAVGAQDSPAGEAEADPPGRVGRLSEMTGQVWLYSPSAGEWIEAVRNRPITDGDRLSTEGAARAEMRIGSTTVRLDSGTELEVLKIDDTRIELQLHNGSMTVRLRNREGVDEFSVVTDEGRFRAQRTGRYRIDRIDETSHLTVTSGSALYEGPGSALTVHSGQRAEFWIDRGNVAQYTISEPKRDAFAAWSSARDRNDDRSASSRYVSPEMTGVEDLDRHGRWEQSEEYGALWTPRNVPVGWAPYSTGHWVWIHPWGWTWVDDAPWGFAPFHYGRWVYYRSNWCWTPGVRVHRPVYAPALVAWVGGPRVSVSVNIGGPVVGWFPLAPREAYVPSYRVSPRYVRAVNHTHAPQIASVQLHTGNPQAHVGQRDFSNRKFAHAVTVVPTGVFTQRQPVAPAARSLRERHDARELTQEVARGATLVAAPVEAPPRRTLEPRTITSPGMGNAEGPGRRPAPGTTAGPGNIARPWLRTDDERRGGARAPGGPEVVRITPTAPTAPAVTAPQRPQVPPAAQAQAPQAPQAPQAAQAPQAVNAAPAAQPVVPAPAPAAPRSAPPAAAPPVAAPVAIAPAVITPRPPPAQEPREQRSRQPRPPGNEVPVVAARPEARAPAAPVGTQRGNHALRPLPPRTDAGARAAPPAPRVRPVEPQPRERGEPVRQERREGRDRREAN